jgi:sugar/nucleoside kinase (ribokinase family)
MAEIGCAGILVADTICGPMDHLPHEGQLLAVDSLPVRAGGCAANVAISLRKQGIDADVAGCLGKDPSAQVIVSTLTAAGVGCEHVSNVDGLPSSQTIILLVRGEDRRYIHMFGANQAFSVAHIDRAWLSKLRVFYLGGLFVLPGIKTDELLDLLRFCRENGTTTMLDVVIPHKNKGMGGLERLLPYVDYFLPNGEEASLLTGTSDPLEQIRVFQGCGASTVIVTLGEAGAIAARGQDVYRAEAFKVESVDPSGGGDAFSAGVIAGMVRGWDLPKMLALGSVLGASATLALGTTDGVFTASQVEAFLQTHSIRVSQERLE